MLRTWRENTSFGSCSTAAKIINSAIEYAYHNKYIHTRCLDANVFNKLTNVLAKLITKNLDYKQYQRFDEVTKQQIRRLLAEAYGCLIQKNQTKFTYNLAYDEGSDFSRTTYYAIYFPEFFNHCNSLANELNPTFIEIKKITLKKLLKQLQSTRSLFFSALPTELGNEVVLYLSNATSASEIKP